MILSINTFCCGELVNIPWTDPRANARLGTKMSFRGKEWTELIHLPESARVVYPTPPLSRSPKRKTIHFEDLPTTSLPPCQPLSIIVDGQHKVYTDRMKNLPSIGWANAACQTSLVNAAPRMPLFATDPGPAQYG
jgi:hypothetical protein